MFFAVPPLVILIPAFLAFSVQLAAAVIGLGAVIAMVTDRTVEVGLSLFNRVLAMRTVVGVSLRRRGHKPHKGCCHKGCYCGLS
jgi:sorbitol-specific phosphotransferase system component IIBC